MPWGAAAAVVGAGLSAASTSSASRRQQSAADQAAAEQRRQFDLTRADQQPYRQAGTNALADLVRLSGQYGQAPTAEQVMAQPGYQFGLTQGMNAVNNQGAATGGLYSGAQLRAAGQFANDYATTKYDDAFNRNRLQEGDTWNRYSALAGIGQTATNQLQSAGQNYANNVGQIGMSNANAQGAATIAQGNQFAGLANQAASWWNQRQQPNAGYYGGSAWGGAQIQPGQNYNYGDQQTGWAGGGPVYGPGGPQDDLIPAQLSNGEHVIDAAAVTALGNGSNLQGQEKLNRLRAAVSPQAMHAALTGDEWNQLPPKVQALYRAWLAGGEPVVGSRSPLPRGGTGGGLSRNALLEIAPPVVVPEVLPASPVMNPKAIVENRLKKAGA